MPSTKKKAPRPCALCGETLPWTDQHVFPSSFFPKEDRPELIKVPCCYSCNEEARKDEEYLRGTLVVRLEAFAKSAAAKEVWKPILRSLTRSGGEGFRRTLLKNVRQVRIELDGKIVKTAVYEVDSHRTTAAISRIVKGLYFHHFGEPLEETRFEIRAWDLRAVEGNLEELLELVNRTKNGGLEVRLGQVVEYWMSDGLDEENPSVVWLLRFFDTAEFLGATVERQ